MMRAFWIAVTVLLLSGPVPAQHLHGVNEIPDWYDAECCNLRDCKPVDDETITFGRNAVGAPVVIYTEAERIGHKGEALRVFEYEKSRWRSSKDERYHACHSGSVVYCVYIRPGV